MRQPALNVAPGTSEAACAHIRAAAQRLRLVNQQIRQVEAQIGRLCRGLDEQLADDQEPAQRDVEILSSSPGIGKIILATLLAETFQALRARDYHALRCLSGCAPVTRQSGKKAIVVRRLACNGRLRDALYHWARVAVQCDDTCRAKYTALRAKGHSHGRALRSVADRLLKVLCRMLEYQTLYDHASARMTRAS